MPKPVRTDASPALDPALVARLTRPAARMGVIEPGWSRRLWRRLTFAEERLPLLGDWERRIGRAFRADGGPPAVPPLSFPPPRSLAAERGAFAADGPRSDDAAPPAAGGDSQPSKPTQRVHARTADVPVVQRKPIAKEDDAALDRVPLPTARTEPAPPPRRESTLPPTREAAAEAPPPEPVRGSASGSELPKPIAPPARGSGTTVGVVQRRALDDTVETGAGEATKSHAPLRAESPEAAPATVQARAAQALAAPEQRARSAASASEGARPIQAAGKPAPTTDRSPAIVPRERTATEPLPVVRARGASAPGRVTPARPVAQARSASTQRRVPAAATLAVVPEKRVAPPPTAPLPVPSSVPASVPGGAARTAPPTAVASPAAPAPPASGAPAFRTTGPSAVPAPRSSRPATIQRKAAGGGGACGGLEDEENEPSADETSEKVRRQLLRDFAIENERRGWSSWR